MNRAAKFAIAAGFLSLSFTGASQAEGWGMNSSGAMQQTIRHFDGGFNIERTYNWYGLPEERDGPRSAPPRSTADMRAIRASIADNAALRRKLADQGVRIADIVNVQQALNGSLTIYTR